MQRLNAKKNQWREFQQTQLDQYNSVNADLRLAFPGSMLFNHFLLTTADDTQSANKELSVPDVSELIYEFCSSYVPDPRLAGAVVIDVGESVSDALAEVVGRELCKLQPRHLVCLGVATQQLFGENIKKYCNGLSVSTIEPDWMSATSLHSIYRQAQITVFVGTLRVLDAAATGCNSLLIADADIENNPVFPVLHNYLTRCDSKVICAGGTAHGANRTSSFMLVDNNHHSLKLASAKEMVDQDWLAEFIDRDNTPLIRPYRTKKNVATEYLNGKKIQLGRKTAKLTRDPVAFFLDSKNTVLQRIGRILRSMRNAENVQ